MRSVAEDVGFLFHSQDACVHTFVDDKFVYFFN